MSPKEGENLAMSLNAQNTAQSLSNQQEDRTIVGYTYDGAAYHPECLPDGIDRNNIDVVGAVFSWSEEACRYSCDVCLVPLLECDSDDEEEECV